MILISFEQLQQLLKGVIQENMPLFQGCGSDRGQRSGCKYFKTGYVLERIDSFFTDGIILIFMTAGYTTA